MIRDRDRIYGASFHRRVRSLNIEEVLTAPRSPWQNPYTERIIDSASIKEIHGAPNRTRYAMNGALIAIGCRGGALMEKAIAAPKRIGPMDVDHGETGCKTPDAASYIEDH